MEAEPRRGTRMRWEVMLLPAHRRDGDDMYPLWKAGAQS